MKVLLEAPIFTQSGYGEHSRLVLDAIRENAEIDLYISPLEWGRTSWNTSYGDDFVMSSIHKLQNYIAVCQHQQTQATFDLQIFIGIPNEFQKKAKHSICVTAGIETDRVSYNWIVKTHQGIDKIIVPSEHAKSGFVHTHYEVENNRTKTKTKFSCNCPVDVVPYPVKDLTPANIGLDLETDFNFLSVALFGPRKNIENSLLWFIEEFKDDPNVGLVLKTGFYSGSQIDRAKTIKHLKNVVERYKDRKCKIYLLHGSLTEEEIHSLYVHPKIKAYMSATHGEGFGLPIFEAAYSGLPIVATDWSAHTEFLESEYKNKKNSKSRMKKLFAKVDFDLSEIEKQVVWEDVLVEGSRWAYPKRDSFKRQLRNVKDNYQTYAKWASTLKENILLSHKKEKVLSLMRDSIFDSIKKEEASNQEIDKIFESLSNNSPNNTTNKEVEQMLASISSK